MNLHSPLRASLFLLALFGLAALPLSLLTRPAPRPANTTSSPTPPSPPPADHHLTRFELRSAPATRSVTVRLGEHTLSLDELPAQFELPLPLTQTGLAVEIDLQWATPAPQQALEIQVWPQGLSPRTHTWWVSDEATSTLFHFFEWDTP